MRSNARNPLAANAFQNSLSGSVHPCTLPDASFCLAKTSLLRGTTAIHGGTDTCYRVNHNCPAFILEASLEIKQVLRADPALLQIGDTDTRREHKLTAGRPKNVRPCTFLGYEFASELASAWNHRHPWRY